MYAKAISIREEELRESRSTRSRLSRSSRGDPAATPKKPMLRALTRSPASSVLDVSQRMEQRDSDTMGHRSTLIDQTSSHGGPMMKRGPQSLTSCGTDSLSESGSDRPHVQLSVLFLPPSQQRSSASRGHKKRRSDFVATPHSATVEHSLSDSGSRLMHSPSRQPRIAEEKDKRDSLDMSMMDVSAVATSRLGMSRSFNSNYDSPEPSVRMVDPYASPASVARAAGRARTASDDIPVTAEKTSSESTQILPASDVPINLPLSSSNLDIELTPTKPITPRAQATTPEAQATTPKAKDLSPLTSEGKATTLIPNSSPSHAARLLAVLIPPRSPKSAFTENPQPATPTPIIAPSGNKVTPTSRTRTITPTHKRGGSESGMFVL